jgi:hypothetical protein
VCNRFCQINHPGEFNLWRREIEPLAHFARYITFQEREYDLISSAVGICTDKEENQDVWSFRILQMNNSHFTIRNLAAVALLALGPITSARADVLTYTAVPVISVNQNDHSFTVHWASHAKSDHGMSSIYTGASRERTIKTNDKTTFWVGSTKGSWANVTKGAHVTVTAHSESSGKVADRVQIVSGP